MGAEQGKVLPTGLSPEALAAHLGIVHQSFDLSFGTTPARLAVSVDVYEQGQRTAEGQVELGWTRIDPARKYSHWSMAVIAEKKNAQGHWVTRPRDPIREPPPEPKPDAPTGRGQ